MSGALSIRQQQQQLVLSGTEPSSEFLDLDPIIVEILSRLPPKSLLCFRCVCKAWRALISDPYFIRQHLSRANNSYSYSLLVKDKSTFRSIDSEALFKCGDGPFPCRELYFPVNDLAIDFNNLLIVGSCNGLICLGTGWDLEVIMLWNPCTREIKVLPKPPEDIMFAVAFYGFGYDSATDDYKVIAGAFRYTPSNHSRGKTQAELLGYSGFEHQVLVYTLSTGSWRELHRLNDNFRPVGRGYSVNGALHWVPYKCNWDDVDVADKLVSFNLAKEIFHHTAAPYFPSSIDRRFPFVTCEGEIRNSLATHSWIPGLELVMWVMKEAGVEKSWNEVVKTPKEVLPVLPAHFGRSWTPLCIFNECLTLIEVRYYHGNLRMLTLYNPKENRYRNVTNRCVLPAAVTYVETLVSPFTSTGK